VATSTVGLTTPSKTGIMAERIGRFGPSDASVEKARQRPPPPSGHALALQSVVIFLLFLMMPRSSGRINGSLESKLSTNWR
ncbi:hypothetical protein E4U48_000297, partial [Claviceps purpurea]